MSADAANRPRALVIGGGPAGLMAASVLAGAGLGVTVAEAMPTFGRKFLMAGKSGLNLTKDEPAARFAAHYAGGEAAAPRRAGTEGAAIPPALAAALAACGPAEVMDWARGLGQEVFTGSSGRVFPVAMKASPLLRAWLAQLGAAGVDLRSRWRWLGWEAAGAQSVASAGGGGMRGTGEGAARGAQRPEQVAVFATPQGRVLLPADVTVLATGGASWRRLGSDGAWAAHLPGQVARFRPANMGFRIDWSPRMARHFGQPVKNVALVAGNQRVRGEFVITRRGIEGGGVYAVAAALRDGAGLRLDLLPDLSAAEVAVRLGRPRGKDSQSSHLRKALRLDPVRIALLHECAHPLPADPGPLIKALALPLSGPAPLDEAISTAGGLRFDALDAGLMLKDRPGVFAAGEMLDWEAPTGGYLITACLATARHAAQAAAAWARRAQA